MWHKILLSFLLLFPAFSWGQYYTITTDSQNPVEQYVIDSVFTGNTPFLRQLAYDNGAPIDLTGWSMAFYYSYGLYSTNGGAIIPGVVIASNKVDYLGATNIFFKPFDDYYFSIKGISTEGYVKTFATGRMIQRYDPSTATNLVSMMGAINMGWWSNNVGAQVESNRLNIIILTTGKTDLVTYNAHVAAQANSNLGFQAFDTAQVATNANHESRIASNETFRITTQPATNLNLQMQITAVASTANAAYPASNPSNFLTTAVNRYDSLYVADLSKLGTNIAGLTQGVYAGSLTSVSYTGVTEMVIGRTYVWGYTKLGADGTSTLSIASQSLLATAVGATSNHFTYTTADTNLILKLDGNGMALCNVSNIYVRQVTNGNINAAGNMNIGGNMYLNGVLMVNPALHIAATGTNVHGLGDLLESKKFVATLSAEQVVNAGGMITPYSNVKVNNTNGVTIALGNPQVATNGVVDGTIMYLRGSAGTGGIQFINGNGVATDCELGFLLKPEDTLQFVFMDGKWMEVKRIDK
jgi:hypothetical protein